ncbi:MAG: hypothetical protein HF978_21420 [Desulfobacteraceae bacterium]|nr:hypothetical protein [Desulfobacteraceae bacterium]MBC2758108.1 hypothetical protein [Desulfobacteraceae bacterium]
MAKNPLKEPTITRRHVKKETANPDEVTRDDGSKSIKVFSERESHLRKTRKIAKIASWEIDIKSGALYWSEEVCRKGKSSTDRAILMELLYRYCNIKQPEIGLLIGGINYSAVNYAQGNRIWKSVSLRF